MSKSRKNTAPEGMPKILVLDIETAPVRAFVWRLWKENIGINQIDGDWYMLCWAAKWFGADEIYSDAIINHKKLYRRNPESDSKILPPLWELLDEADFVVTHNGNRFDLPKINSRFVYNGEIPPSPYKSVDTCAIAKTRFGFTSNKLAYLSEHLGVGEKIDTGGFELWAQCLQGDPTAWKEMIEYNINDVRILEGIYEILRPWATTHPNFALYVDDTNPMCTVCGSPNLIKDGFSYTTVGKFQGYKCKDCGKNMRGRYSLLTKEEKKSLLTSAI